MGPFSWPPKNSEKRQAINKAFQELWVAGTMGAFFTAFARNLPGHFREFMWPPDWPYTIDRFTRYGYLLWFLAYFFISNFQNKQSKIVRGKDIFYDVLQSGGALVVAYVLGFVVPCESCTVRLAYGFTNGTIFVICLFSLILFHRGPHPSGVNPMRAAGLLISILSIGLTFAILPQTGSPSVKALLAFGGLLLLLLVLLAAYISIRVTKPARFWLIRKNTRVSASGEGERVDISSVSCKTWQLTLALTENMHQRSVDVTVQSSTDGEGWENDPGCSFPSQSVINDPKDQPLDLSQRADIKFLRARWTVNAPPAGAPVPAVDITFALQLRAEEGQ